MALWWKKYMDSEERELEEDLKRRKAEFEQQMAERKELDKYMRKQARKERLLSRPGGSFESKKKKAHYDWLGSLPPQAHMAYQQEQERRRQRKKKKKRPYLQRATVASPRRYTHDGKPIHQNQVGVSGAPQFMNLQQMGYHSPENLGFHRSRAQDMQFSPIEQRNLRNMQFQNAAIQQQAMRARASQPMFQAQREQARMLTELLRDADPAIRGQWLERLGGGR
tara:strand:+ start:986 stop:1654 length:669 start_codon:yes stop_codon:yes gene_type:complete